ncbi:MAG: alpha/beta fold hydrolase [Acidobacteriota bacterium]
MVRWSTLCAVLAGLALLSGSGARAQSPAPQDEPPVQSGFVPVENGRLFYEAAGRGEPLLLLHDGILHRESWCGQFPQLAAHYRVVRYDRRGFGRSDPPAAPYSSVADLFALMNALEIDRAILVGCSSGGQLAVDFALEHPEKVRALLLEGVVVSGAPLALNLVLRGGRRDYGATQSPEEATAYWTGTDPFFLAPESVDARAQARDLLLANPQNWRPEKNRFERPPRRTAYPNLRELDLPVLILTGEFDIADVHAQAGVLEREIPGARRLVVPHSGHLVHMEQPAVFNQAVRDFFETGRLFHLLRTRDAEEALSYYRDLRKRVPGILPLEEAELNLEGYQLLGQGRVKQAVAAMRIGADLYPDSWNAYDSLGEVLLADGQREEGILNYRKSLRLNPGNTNARDVLAGLGVPIQEPPAGE